ncbi:MAG: glycerophosphodiester phosphodiesterase family protein, partial [Dehalococcoidia bacterium]
MGRLTNNWLAIDESVSYRAMPTLVIGHAAAAGEAPANTLAGVRACLDAGAEGMEIDVQLCADGAPVLMHDETVNRTTNLKGKVRELSLLALQGADAGEGEPVPTLEQVLELVKGRLTVMCELK